MTEENQKLGQLHQREIELIHLMRTRFRWGDLVINMRDGLPFRVLKGWESQDLGIALDKDS